MNCQKFKEYLYQHMDQELEENVSVEMKEHISTCPLCQLEYEKEKKINDMIRHHMVKEEAPFELREAIVDKLEQEKNAKVFPNLSWLKPVSRYAGVGAVTFVLMFTVFANNTKAFPLFSESIATHLEFLKGSYPMEIQSENLDEVLTWFQGKTEFAVQKPHIALSQAKLKGARIVHVKDRKAAYFIFEKDGHEISAFYMDLQGAKLPAVSKENRIDRPEATIMAKREKGFQSILCLHKIDKTGCIFVSDLPQKELMELLS